ncbi:pilus assembly protein [Propionivibrio sp.]|uniref:pilus assembly protein n=1 Tax=Propionivibrio sp. TaxID=2212460 RepID=UPI0039E65736
MLSLPHPVLRRTRRIPLWLCALLPAWAIAGATDLATAPMVTSSTTSVKPNVMFVLDDSGSMADAYMPDVAANFSGKYGYYGSQCNGLAYNPEITYTPPVDYQGTSYANASVSAAWKDGYSQSSGTTNLSSDYYYVYSGAQTSAAQKTYYDTGSTFYQECNTSTSKASAVFTKVLVSTLTATQKTNYANWYSYYRTRMLAMKTATGLAFAGIDNRYRLGFMTINNNGGSDLLNIADFDSTQKKAWYAKLYAATANGSTPTRSALAIAGRIFANKISSYNSVSVVDPMQYSCQQNFAIMASDGFWNSGSCNNGSAGCYNGGAGTKLDGSTNVGNQDGGAARPYFDGSATTTVVTTTNKTYTKTYTYASCSTSKKRIVETTTTVTTVTVTTNGVVTSEKTSSASADANYEGCSSSSSALPVSVSGTADGYPKTSSSTTTSGVSNSMADVAYYYYATDLRSSDNGNETGVLGVNVAKNNVPGTTKDSAAWQHMTTFTLGLGAYGRMIYSASYESDTAGDYFNVYKGTVNSADGSPCSWVSSGGTCNWPTPASNAEENIDDLWHAAVNGRGTYYSATDPGALSKGLSGALSGVSARVGSAASATTSNPNVTTGDDYVFSTTFVSQSWYGELVRQTIDLSTGTVATIKSDPCTSSECDWSAKWLLDARTAAATDSRTIYTYDPANAYGSNRLKSFAWGNLTSAEQAHFGTSAVSSLSQYADLSTANKTAAAGENLVNYLRGRRGYEGTLYRARDHILGDIVSSETVYVKKPQFSYTDSGYGDFKSNNASRTAMVYVGANDGMLHAFNASTGQEAWAYIPSLVLPNLHKLADTNYANNHAFFVDGTVVIGDVCVSGCTGSSPEWRTILVGGLNGGGRGYYALDVTDPASPKALWEFTHDTGKGEGYTTDADLGYSYGNPIITKNGDGTWVVLLASGYNNVNPGTGGGYLFVLQAYTGAMLSAVSGTTSAGKLATGAGSTSTVSGACSTAPCPSGLTRINAWADDTSTDNTALRVYGGDLFGNLWRFDINDSLGAAGYDAQHLATLADASGNRQPVMAKPELGLVDNLYAGVFVGTGKYLGTTDVTDTSTQSFYAIKDTLATDDWGVVRGRTDIVKQTVSSGTDSSGASIRTVTKNAVDWASNIGWFLDLPDSGERANTDPTLALGTLVFTTNIPNSSACTIGGESWIYYLDYTSGSYVGETTYVGQKLGNELSTRAELVILPSGSVVSLTRLSGGSTVTSSVPVSSGSGSVRRILWRELIND